MNIISSNAVVINIQCQNSQYILWWCYIDFVSKKLNFSGKVLRVETQNAFYNEVIYNFFVSKKKIKTPKISHFFGYTFFKPTLLAGYALTLILLLSAYPPKTILCLVKLCWHIRARNFSCMIRMTRKLQESLKSIVVLL